MKRVLHEKVDLLGHILVRDASFYAHVVEFTPLDRSFIRVRSWHAPSNIRHLLTNWLLISTRKIKRAQCRELWRAMRKRGYWIWLDGQIKEQQEYSCAS